MSGSQDDLEDIFQNFVHNDLASLDRIGGGPDSFALSPHLTDQSPVLQQPSPQTAASADGFTPTTSDAARQGPQIVAPAPPTMATTAAAAAGGDGAAAAGSGSRDLPAAPESGVAPTKSATPTAGSDVPSRGAPAGDASAAAPAAAPASASAGFVDDSRQASRRSSVRNISSSSTASVSTQEREKRSSLGDKFKMFGKRITSGSKK